MVLHPTTRQATTQAKNDALAAYGIA